MNERTTRSETFALTFNVYAFLVWITLPPLCLVFVPHHLFTNKKAQGPRKGDRCFGWV